MFEKILAAVDLGPETELTLSQAVRWAHRFGSAVFACHVTSTPAESCVSLPQGHAPGVGPSPEHTSGIGAELSRRADEAAAELGRPIETVLDVGVPAQQIVHRSQLLKADLVAVGTSGRTGIERLFLGSVAESVVRTCVCPVLVVRPGDDDGPVMAATDLTDGSFPAIEAAANLAQQFGRQLVVVHALAHSMLAPQGLARRDGSHADRFISARGWIFHALAKLRVHGEEVVLEGPPEDVIPAQAALRGASLLVVGTRGRTRLARVFIGSVAESLVRHAPCSVLAVRMVE